MSYKLTDSAAVRFLTEFYQGLLIHRQLFSAGAYTAREALWNYWKGRFGLSVGLQDWIVPTTYVSSDQSFEEELLLLIPKVAGSEIYIGQRRQCSQRTSTFLLWKKIRGSARENFFNELTSRWLRTGLTKTVIHIQDQDQSGLSPETLNLSPEFRFSGEYVTFQRNQQNRPRSYFTNLLDLCMFLHQNETESQRYAPHANKTEYLFIVDGFCPFTCDGTKTLHDAIWVNWLISWSKFNAFFLIGSYCGLHWMQEELEGVPLLTLSDESANSSSESEAVEFERFLKDPQIVLSNQDIFNILCDSAEIAGKSAQAIPGFKHAEKVFRSLCPEDQEKLLCLAPFSNAGPYEADKFIHLVLNQMSLIRKPLSLIAVPLGKAWKKLARSGKTGESSRNRGGKPMEELLDYLSIYGLGGIENITVNSSSKLGATRELQLDPLLQTYHTGRLAALSFRTLSDPLQILAEKDQEYTDILFGLEMLKEETWGFWNLVSPILTWLDERNDHSDILYPKFSFGRFMEPRHLAYERLNDAIFVDIAHTAVDILAAEHDCEVKIWYHEFKAVIKKQFPAGFRIWMVEQMKTSERQQLMVERPRRYWSIFTLILGFSNWLCRALREQDNHCEFNCWIQISEKLFRKVEELKSGSPERQLEMELIEPSFRGLAIQAEGAKQLLLLHKLWPDNSAQVPGKYLFELRLLGVDPEHDGVPWPEEEKKQLESDYLELKENGMIAGMLSDFSWALSRLRAGEKWMDIRENAELMEQSWLKKGMPDIRFQFLDREMNAKGLNQVQAQVLIAKEQWNGCLVFLAQVSHDDDNDADKASLAFTSAYCLQHLDRWTEAEKKIQEAFSHTSRIENQDSSRLDLLRSLYITVKNWPETHKGGTIPPIGSVLLFTFKLGSHDSGNSVYARNGTLLKLLVTEIAPGVGNIEDHSNETLGERPE
ncbi:hypothetical protein K432DRAFT_403035 [Lepidopterella palustris CBS 459.81]|uniref:Uncharacterized protein n=1 Tax=Lepidopterella palustris CBS 459.81 TaxID=1314670 RepID=A0A8E2JHM2_9PEZI|nr:hypothetical protein K432DRAFT_403035 [Lepidopterella palustris CBS 459.81]